MDDRQALACLAALAQSTRLEAFRLLVTHEPEGIPAGEIARRLDVPQNTMSTHLAALADCGLAASERRARSILYRADLECFQALMLYMLEDCCGGRASVCAPILAGITPCCQPTSQRIANRND